jgi:hypothetical protein
MEGFYSPFVVSRANVLEGPTFPRQGVRDVGFGRRSRGVDQIEIRVGNRNGGSYSVVKTRQRDDGILKASTMV